MRALDLMPGHTPGYSQLAEINSDVYNICTRIQQGDESGFFDERRQPGSAAGVARTLYALFQTRWAEEEARFRSQNPTAVHFER